jgi:mono/diheme cytochrome c family protein
MRVFAFVSSIVAVLAGCFVASSNSDPTPAPSPSPTAGSALAAALGCAGCHGSDFSGGLGPNLTPDRVTGLGGWSDDQIATAIRTGVDDQGNALCSTMPRFATLDDGGANDLVGFLRSLAPIVKESASPSCDDARDAGAVDVGDGGVVIVTDDAGTTPPPCPGFADPNTPAPCHACKTPACQANGCYGGWFCDLSLARCEPKPAGC